MPHYKLWSDDANDDVGDEQADSESHALAIFGHKLKMRFRFGPGRYMLYERVPGEMQWSRLNGGKMVHGVPNDQAG